MCVGIGVQVKIKMNFVQPTYKAKQKTRNVHEAVTDARNSI